MRTRAAILSMLALGFLLSTTGAGLAVGGLADNDQASEAQYPHTPPTKPETTPPTTPESVTPPTTPETSTPPTTPESVIPPTTPETSPPPSGSGALPEAEERTPEQENTPPTDEVLPDRGAAAPEQSEVQPARQVEVAQTGSTLPFTGFAALPVLLLGLALLSGGLIMRRSTRED
jgi:hypothetical protein